MPDHPSSGSLDRAHNGLRKWWLVTCFRDYFRQVLACKAVVSGNGDLSVLPGQVTAAPSGDASLAKELTIYLKRALDDQQRKVMRERTATEEEAYARVHYLLTVLTDEVFLVELPRPVRWGEQEFDEFRRDWFANLLERRLYGSSHGGQTVVEQLEDLLANGSRVPFAEQLAAAYLLALQLGLEGSLRGRKSADELAERRRRLLRLVSTEGGIEQRPALTAQAYEHVENPPPPKSLRRLVDWRWVVVGLVTMYLIFSSALWALITSALEQG